MPITTPTERFWDTAIAGATGTINLGAITIGIINLGAADAVITGQVAVTIPAGHTFNFPVVPQRNYEKKTWDATGTRLLIYAIY